MEQQLQAIATVLSLVNPVICGAMFARIEAGQARGGTRAPGGFLSDTAMRFMGLIIVAMGVRFALTGVRSFFLAQPRQDAQATSSPIAPIQE